MSTQLLVTDLQRAIDFYTNKLGFTLDFLYDDFYSGLTKDGYSIHLKLAAPAKEERENRKEHGHLDLIFSVDGVDSIFEDLLKKSVEIVQPLCDQPYGREFYISDPDGYIIAYLEEKDAEIVG